MPDLSGLERPEPWAHFDPADEEDALAALRARMGASFASSPDDDVLTLALGRAVAFLERATGRIFVPCTGRLALDGTGSWRLFLPLPVVSVGQGGEGITELVISNVYADGTAVSEGDYVVNDGVGIAPNDPRDNPYVDLQLARSGGSTSASRSGCFPRGVRNVHVTGSWGYLDENGETPELVRHALARLTIRCLTEADDPDAVEDLHRGALVSEQTQGRSYTLAPHAAGAGITTDREIDGIIRTFRRPPEAVVSTPPRRRYGASYP